MDDIPPAPLPSTRFSRANDAIPFICAVDVAVNMYAYFCKLSY